LASSRATEIRSTVKNLLRWLRIAAISGILIVAIATAIVVWLWQDRSELSELEWPLADAAIEPGEAVTVTWLGVTTLLFDDHETQILIDGFFSRPGIPETAFRRIKTDIASVNFAMAKFQINRLAAIVPVHSHFDHAMDVGIVANRSSAVVLGSESTANIARGADLPVNQYQILANGETRKFGDFTITLILSRHAPIADGKKPWFPGSITSPLRQPARVNEWKEGQSFSILIGHPRGTTLIQGSAGYVRENLKHVSADVVMLGVAGLSGLGRQYTEHYWRETVTRTGATRVYTIHFDDFFRPFGDILLLPNIADNVVEAASWINEFAASEETPVDIRLPPFGKPIVLY